MTAPCPPDILAVFDSNGELTMTQEQLRRFIGWEAGLMGLTFEQAVAAAEAGTLSRTCLGSDVDLLIRSLEGQP